MTHVLILGANGQLARHTTTFLLKHPEVRLTLYLRRSNRLKNPDPARVRIVEGDVLDDATLQAAMQGQDVVFASLVGDMKRQAQGIVAAMQSFTPDTSKLSSCNGELAKNARGARAATTSGKSNGTLSGFSSYLEAMSGM